jgi:hypothetical protein
MRHSEVGGRLPSDPFVDGRRLHMRVEDCTRECLAPASPDGSEASGHRPAHGERWARESALKAAKSAAQKTPARLCVFLDETTLDCVLGRHPGDARRYPSAFGLFAFLLHDHETRQP